MAAQVGVADGHGHHMGGGRCDRLLATRAQVGLGGSHRGDAPYLHHVTVHLLQPHAQKLPSGPVSALETRVEQGVMTVTLNRPHVRNAANDEVWTGLDRALADAASDRAVRVVVITGAGGAFCSGQDLSEHLDIDPLARMRWMADLAARLHHLPKPTIAKVGGVAAGAGANLALGCDLVVASREARFIEIFSKRGLSLDFGGSWLLPRLVGMAKAKELALLAEPLSAEQAEAIGLVNRVVDADELDPVVAGWAEQLAAGPPHALSLTKALLNDSFGSTLEQALEAEGLAQTINLTGAESREALAAFRERRPPAFS